MRFIFKLLGTLIGLAALAVIGLVFVAYEPLPSREELVALYHRNADAYARRTESIRQSLDKNEAVKSTRDEILGYFAVETGSDPFSVLYFTHSSGIGVGRYGVGLAYFEIPPQRTYSSLDAMKEDAAKVEGFRGYGSIEGNWYYAMWEAD